MYINKTMGWSLLGSENRCVTAAGREAGAGAGGGGDGDACRGRRKIADGYDVFAK